MIADARFSIKENSMPSITRNLNILARCGNQFRSLALASEGISAAQAPYILHICSRPGMSQEQLARALHVNPSNAARQLSLLENAEFIQRKVSPQDKRLMEIHPTDKARRAEPLILKVNERWNAFLTKGMSGEQLRLLESMLDMMRARAVSWDEGKEGPLL